MYCAQTRAPPAAVYDQPGSVQPGSARAALEPRGRRALGVRPEPPPRDGRLDRGAQLRRVVGLEPVARLLARVRAAQHLRRADIGGQRLGEQQHRQPTGGRDSGPGGPPAPAVADQLRRLADRGRRQHRQRRVGGQEPAAEVTGLHAQVDEQRQRDRDEHQAAHHVATKLDDRAQQRGDRGGPAEAPGEAVEVVRDAARLLAGLRLVARHLGLVAEVAPPGVERREQVRVEHHEHDGGEHRRDREPAERPPAVHAHACERGDRDREERQARRVLERDREPGSTAGQEEPSDGPTFVGANREAEG